MNIKVFKDFMMIEPSRRARPCSIETGGLPLVSTFALLTIVAGQLQGSGYTEQEPEFLSPLENLTIAQGRDVHFTCTVNHLDSYKVAWIKSDTKTILAIHTHMVTLNPRLSVTHNGHNTWKLYISNVEPKDSGTYMCQINTDPMKSQMGHLSVVIPPDIADVDDSEASAPEGGSVELRCSAAGVPEPIISWKRTAGRNIVLRDETGQESKVVDSYVGSTLVLKSLRKSEMGTYLCIAANGIPPTKSRRYEVSVLFAPIVRVQSPVVLRSQDMHVTLQCVVEASPKSLNVWQRGKTLNGGKLLNSSKYVISEEVLSEYSLRMNLTINRLKKSDFGDYSCMSSNAYGKADGNIFLKETPQITTTTTTTTTTTQRPTTTRKIYTSRTTTTAKTMTSKQPKRHQKKPHDRLNVNTIESDSRQIEINNALNFYNANAYGIIDNNSNDSNNTYNKDYAQKTEKQKVRPSGPPRHYVVYNSASLQNYLSVAFVIVYIKTIII